MRKEPTYRYTVDLPVTLDEAVRECMAQQGIGFTELARRALTVYVESAGKGKAPGREKR